MKLLPKIIIYVLFLVAYSLLVFLLNADYTVVFGLSYAFAALAVLVQFTCTILVAKKISSGLCIAVVHGYQPYCKYPLRVFPQGDYLSCTVACKRVPACRLYNLLYNSFQQR